MNRRTTLLPPSPHRFACAIMDNGYLARIDRTLKKDCQHPPILHIK